MTILWSIPGLILPTLTGWLLLRTLEWKTPVLFRLERWMLGFLLGLTLTMFVTFVVHIATGMALTLRGYLIIQTGLVIVIGTIWGSRESGVGSRGSQTPNPEFPIPIPQSPIPKLTGIAIVILLIWTLTKILTSGVTFLILTPPYLDDTIDNWNLRGKVFFVDKKIELNLPDSQGEFALNEISSYPPTVPLAKASLASFADEWNEGLVNGVHLLWFLTALVLLFYAIYRGTRGETHREVSLRYAFIGTYILASLPLYMMHGTNPYADVFLSAHIFAAISMLFHAVSSKNRAERMAFMRIGGVTAAIMIFTKNEGLMIYAPAIALVLAGSLIYLKKTKGMSVKEVIITISWYAIPSLLIAVPWTIYKWNNGLTFGNAQALSNLGLSRHPGVLNSIAINTFLEGNWLLLFPILIFLLIFQRRTAFFSPLLILTGFFLIVFLGQLFLYMFTFLHVEALYQTGYARGLVQVAPVAVLLTIILINKTLNNLFTENR